MGKHQCQQPTLIDMLVGIAIEAVALRGFKTFTVNGDATEQQLDAIEQAVADIKHDWATDWPRLLDYEKIIPKNQFVLYYDVNPIGKIRLSRDPWAEMRACWKKLLEADQIENQQTKELLESRVYLNYWQKKLIRARTILYWFYIPSSPRRASKVIDTCYEKFYAMAEPEYDWQREPKKFSLMSLKLNYRFTVQSLVNMLEKTYNRFHGLYFRTITEQRGSQLIVALRRYKNEHGRWPETLEAIKNLVPTEILVDPINGGSFVYKLTEENFTLYSKGKNNIDEGGERDWDSGADDWRIWPPKTRKNTKEEEANDEQQ